MTEKEIIEILKATAVDSRLQIIKLIRDKKYCVNTIARNVGISQSAVSQHLKILKDCNLVFSERYGSIIHYQLNKYKIQEFLTGFSEIINIPENDR